MKSEAKEIREMAEVFKKAAAAADKMADILEDENHTKEQEEEAMKDFMWQMVKLQQMSK